MKRSEALEEIRKILAINGRCDDYGELEEAILHHLETIGMLPPFVDLDKPVGDKDYFTLHVDQAAYAGLCEWESEDE